MWHTHNRREPGGDPGTNGRTGTWGSRSGFSSGTAAENWGAEQEALIRRNMWIDPRDAETPFGEFAEEWYEAVVPRLELNTRVKYRSY